MTDKTDTSGANSGHVREVSATEYAAGFWRKTCSMCGAYYAPYCYGIELMPGSDRELERPYTTEPDDWCALWRREPKTEWNGKPCGRRRVQ